MPFYVQGGGLNRNRQQPDIHDLLQVAQYMSPEAQTERQLNLQRLQGQLQYEQASRAHEDAATQQLQMLTGHLPTEWANQTNETNARIGTQNASTLAENLRAQLEQGQLTAQPQVLSDAHLKSVADLGLVNAETTKASEIDPMKLLGEANLVDQATKNSALLSVLNLREPALAGLVKKPQSLTDFTSLAQQVQQGKPIQVGDTTVPTSVAPKMVGSNLSVTDPTTGLNHYFDAKTGQRTTPDPSTLGLMDMLNIAPPTQTKTPDIDSFLKTLPAKQPMTPQQDPVVQMINSLTNSPFGKF